MEVRAGLEEDLRGLGITMEDFKKHVLPRYGKTLYEWTEDVIKPRTHAHEDVPRSREGDRGRPEAALREQVRREAAGQAHLLEQGRREDRPEAVGRGPQGRREFDSVARTQADPNLAGRGRADRPGRQQRLRRRPRSKDASVEKVLFSLKEGEISQLFQLRSRDHVREVRGDHPAGHDRQARR